MYFYGWKTCVYTLRRPVGVTVVSSLIDLLCVCVCVCVSEYLCVCVNMCVYLCVYVYKYVYVCVYMYKYMCVCVSAVPAAGGAGGGVAG